MTANYPFGDARARGQTARACGSNIDGAGGAAGPGWA